jgi:hypothetical protein
MGDLGVDVLSGKDDWEESLARGKAPHETLSGAAAETPAEGSNNGYKRWKPEI